MFKILLYCTIKKEHLLKTPYAVDMDDCQPCLCCHFFTKVLDVDVGHPASAQNQKAFSNYISTIRSTLSLLILSLLYFPRPCYLLHFSVLAQASFIISLSLCFISLLLFTHFEDTLWGIYYIHEAARIQFYSFDETVRNFTLNFLHLTFS